jgi:heat shock protein HtpX
MTNRTSFASRAILAVVLMVGFYILAAGLVFGLLWLVYAQVAYLHRFNFAIVGACLVASYAILKGIFFVTDRFEPPGPEITERDHPRLFAEIRSVAEQMRAEMPARVFLMPDVNAFVAEVGGWMGIVGTKRVMAIGMGLLNVDTVGQFKATIAHEFGHFHGGDTKLGGFLYRTRGSLARVLANLDNDESLLMQLLSKPFEAYTNIFMRLTFALSRRQELDADAWSVRVAGRQAHVDGLRREAAAGNLFYSFLENEVMALVNGNYVPANVYSGFRAFVANLEEDGIVEKVTAALHKVETAKYDTHPALAERIAYAEQLPDTAGKDEADLSRELLSDPDAAERAISSRMLESVRGKGRTEVDWETAPAEVHAARMQEASAALTAVEKSRDDGTVSGLLACLEENDRLALARRIAPDVFTIGGGTLQELASGVLTTVAMARVGEELVARHGFRWDPSPGRHHRVIAPDNTVIDVHDLVVEATKDHAALPTLRERLRALGIDA